MSGERSAAEVIALLHAAGRKLARGEPCELASIGPADVQAALAPESFDLAPLEQAAIRLAALADGDDGDVDAEETLQGALGPRFEAECVLLAAERVTGRKTALSREQETFVAEYDHIVRPRLHRLTAFNELRGAVAAAIAPALRGRFWWWCEGAEIAPEAVSSLAGVAELVARFPEARRELDALVVVARTLREASASGAPVTSLADWAKRRRGGASEESKELRIAAASEQERIDLARTPEYDVMWRQPASVVVDVHVAPRAGAAPSARTASGRVLASSPVPRTIHRYAIELDDATLAEERLVVVIPLGSGDVEVAVPPPVPLDER